MAANDRTTRSSTPQLAGHLKLGARYYNPTTARFTQPDPAASWGGYAYAGDNPTNYTDPTGLEQQPPGPGNDIYNLDGDGNINTGGGSPMSNQEKHVYFQAGVAGFIGWKTGGPVVAAWSALGGAIAALDPWG